MSHHVTLVSSEPLLEVSSPAKKPIFGFIDEFRVSLLDRGL
jgi:hypothetical protein